MQVDDEGGSTHAVDFTIDNPNFDLDVYASSYGGLTKIRRLMFVAKHCPTLRVDSLKLVVQRRVLIIPTLNCINTQCLGSRQANRQVTGGGGGGGGAGVGRV